MGLKSLLRHFDRAYTKGRLFLLWHGARFAEYRRILERNKNPILIGGCGRSGTTLLLSLMSAHPDIYAVPYEIQAFTPGAYPPEEDVRLDGDFHIDFLYKHFLEADVDLGNVARWCEKTPMNVHFFDRLVEYFGPDMRFLNIVRDGREVVTSHHPNDPTTYWVSPNRWVRDVEAGRQVENHEQCLTIKYEDLVEKPSPSLEEICTFVGEEYSEVFEDYPETATIQSSTAWFGKADSLRRRSKERWRKEKHQEIVNQLLNMPQALDHLRHYNYVN